MYLLNIVFLFHLISGFTNIPLSDLDSNTILDSSNEVISQDYIYFQNPNAILGVLGYKPITKDLITVEIEFDSLSIPPPQSKFKVMRVNSHKLSIILDRSARETTLPVTLYYQKNIVGVKNLKIKIAGSYGDWIYFALIPLVILIVTSTIYHKTILKKISEIYEKNIGKYKRIISHEHTSAVESFSFPNGQTTIDNSNASSVALVGEVNRNFTKLLQMLSSNHKNILAEIQYIKLSQEQTSKYEKKIGDREAKIEKLESALESVRQQYKLLEGDYKKFEKSHQEYVNALNESIKTTVQEKTDLQEKFKKLESDFQHYRSRQSEMSANSLQISGVDKKKMDRYKDSCKSIIKTINEVPGIILKQSFENPKIMSLLNQVFLDHYMGNFEDLLKIRDDIENILLYQRTENSLVRNKFPGALSIAFEEFDPKYREIIFDTCIFGKIDKIFIGFRKIYGIKYQIEMSNEDLSQFDKMCDRIKSLENELVQYLQLSGFEPYSISLFEELTVQKSSYIENIGGLSLKEKFPYFEKKPEQRDLILEITQWAYKKDGGLWKNRKALVKIST